MPGREQLSKFSANKDRLTQLLALNQEVAAKNERDVPVTSPGVLQDYPDTKKLMTKDCIDPRFSSSPV